MLKKCLVTTLSVLILASGASMSAKAQMREVIVVTNEEAQSVEEQREAEEAFEKDTPEVEGIEVVEDTDLDVLEEAETITMEEYLDILGEEAAEELTYSLSVSNTEGSILSMQLDIKGFADYAEYSSSGRTSCSFALCCNEDFSNAVSYSGSSGSRKDEDEYVRYFTGKFYGKGDTTYYIRAKLYDSSLKKYVEVGEAVKVTTKEQTKIDASMELVDMGASYAAVEVNAKGIDTSLLGNVMYLQYSKDNSFSNSSRSSMSFTYTAEDGYAETCVAATSMSEQTTYYVRLVMRELTAEGYIYTPLSDEVLEVTTEANETYDDSRIPDETLRSIIKEKTNDKLDKISLERIYYLNNTRSSASDPAIKDLTGIELLTRLTDVTFRYHEITDMSPIAQLTLVDYVDLKGNNIVAIPDLSGLDYLLWLNLEGNAIPTKEFVVTNPNLPEKVLKRNSSWLQTMSNCQRSASDISYTIADTYYSTETGKYPLQVELTDCRYIDEYTLSIYEGDTLIVEDLAAVKRSSEYNWAAFVADAFTDKAGSRSLTFVIKKNGMALPGVTKTVQFKDKYVVSSGTDLYLTPDDKYVSFYGYCYSVGGKIQTLEILDAEGNVLWTRAVSSSYYYESSSDNRYSNIFQYSGITAKKAFFNVYGYMDDTLSVGKYDMRFTLEDGSCVVAKEALTVTEDAVLDYISSSLSHYPNHEHSEYLYVEAEGLSMDWKQVWPEVYDENGAVVSEMVHYKLTGTDSVIYKLRNISDTVWSRKWQFKLAHAANYVILNEGADVFTVSLDSYANIYYTEHMADSGKVLVLCENMEDGKEYEWTIEGYNDTTVLATCTASLTDGRAELEFKNADGSNFVFTSLKENSSYCMRCITTGAKSNVYVTNRNYNMDNIASSYEAISVKRDAHINDGRSFVSKNKLRYDRVAPDTVLTAILYDEYGGVITDKGVVTKELVYEKIAGESFKLWELTISFDGVGWEKGEFYYYDVVSEEENFGYSRIIVLDPEKPYYTIEGESYDARTGILQVYPTGYFPTEMDKNKIGLTVRDSKYNVIYRATAASASGTMADAETLEEKIYLTYDISAVSELIEEEGRFYYQLTYDGEKVWNAYYYENLQEAYTENYGYISYSSSNNRTLLKGVYKTGNEPMTVYFYYPYDAEPVLTLNIPAMDEEAYLFKAEDLKSLAFNSFNTIYDVVMVNSQGKYMDDMRGYLSVAWPFEDVVEDESNWQYIGISYVYNRGVMSGTSTSTFNPGGKLTREMQIQILYNLENKPAVTTENGFVDVAQGQWYSNAITWAAENNITSGVGDGKFGVGANITREQLTVLLFNYAKQKGYDVSKEAALDGYADVAKVNTWSKNALEWAVGMGIVSGKPGNLLDPQGAATRAECAAMMRKFCINYMD